MKKNILGKTGIEVTQVGFGVLPMGPHQRNLSTEEGARILTYALERGINFIDTAQYYLTYPHIKEALSGFDGHPIISSKSLAHGYEEMEAAVSEAIDALGYVDIFLLHEVRPGDFALRKGAWDYLIEAKAKGIIRAIGVSTHHVDVVREVALVPECDVIFPLINYAGLGIRNGDEPGTREDMEGAISLANANGKGIFTMKTFGGGPLVAEYAQCLEYSLGLEDSSSTMIGFASTKDVDDLFDFLEGKIPSIDTSEKVMHIERGSCEGCGSCIERCANEAISFSREDGLAEIDPDKCMTCGYCVPVCPVRAIILY